MSEEAVRQTRSQKRALEREAPPPASEAPPTESDSKKPKLEGPDAESPDPQRTQTPPTPDPKMSQTPPTSDPTPPSPGRTEATPPSPSRTEATPPHGKEAEPEPKALSAPPGKEEQDQKHRAAEPGGPGGEGGERGERGGGARVEPAPDSRTRARPDPKGPPGRLAAGEVKATIKLEVQTGEQPVDMSTSRGIKREKRALTPDEDDEDDEDEDDDDDVIILSDNDSPSPPMNGLSHLKQLDTDLLMRSSPEQRAQIIRRLKVELRLEEAKLVLLKKLRQSQRDLQKPSGSSGSAAPPPLIRGTMTANKGCHQVVSGGRSSGAVIPPPLVRGGQQASSKHGAQVIMPPLVRGAQPISVSPQQIQALRQQQQQQLAASGASGSGSGPPPLLLVPRASAPGAQAPRGLLHTGPIRLGSMANASLLVNISQACSPSLKSSSLTVQSGGSVSVVSVSESPAARQAAAKLALRKQLEKTLLDIPPPKPPAPDFSFMPSAANNEFIYLVGLEEVVQNLLDSISRAKNPGAPRATPAPREPYACSQCSADFTCRWRQDKARGGAVLCEDCMSSNQKKALKAEHTGRLKAAFVKALQQEQEIEQRILQQQTASPGSASSHAKSSSSSTSSSSPSVKVEQLVSQQLKQAQARAAALQQQHQLSRGQHSAARHHNTTIKQGQLSRGGVSTATAGGLRSVPHSFSSSSQLQSAVAAAALVSRPGKHPARVSQGSGVVVGGGGGVRGASGGNASATAWRKQSNTSSGVTMAYVNPSLSGHRTSSAEARQREYLLDMIPSRSLSQTANTWK